LSSIQPNKPVVKSSAMLSGKNEWVKLATDSAAVNSGPAIVFIGSYFWWFREREKIDWQESSKFDCQLGRTIFGKSGRGRKLIGRNPVNLIVSWVGRFLNIKFPQDIGEWPQNQILIPGATQVFGCSD